jgi:hypothetical protein
MSGGELAQLRGGEDAIPELQQLREIENAEAMYRALSTALFIADCIRFTLDGQYDPTKARVMSAEALVCLYRNLYEWRH